MAPPPSFFRNIVMSLLDAMPYLLWIYNSEAPEVRGFDKMKKYRPETLLEHYSERLFYVWSLCIMIARLLSDCKAFEIAEDGHETDRTSVAARAGQEGLMP